MDIEDAIHYSRPLIFVLSVVGTFAAYQNMFDIWLMVLFGLGAYLLRIWGYLLAPAVLAMFQNLIAEPKLRQSLRLSDGDFSVSFTRPIGRADYGYCHHSNFASAGKAYLPQDTSLGLPIGPQKSVQRPLFSQSPKRVGSGPFTPPTSFGRFVDAPRSSSLAGTRIPRDPACRFLLSTAPPVEVSRTAAWLKVRAFSSITSIWPHDTRRTSGDHATPTHIHHFKRRV